MPEPQKRRLPPISPRSESQGNTEDETEQPRRARRKKRAQHGDDEAAESRPQLSRSSSRRRQQNEGTEDESDRGAPPPGPADEGGAVQKPRPKKRKKQNIGTSKETLVAGSDAEAPTSGGETASVPPGGTVQKKKKKKRKPRAEVNEGEGEEYEYGMDLTAVQDDIVDRHEHENDDEPEMTNLGLGVPAMRSEPTNRVYIERKSGFKTKDKVKLAKLMAERQLRAMDVPDDVETKDTTIQFALATHRFFRTMCLFLQGILAGFALWHVVTVWVILAYSGTTGLLVVYNAMALPVQCLYYILLVLCTVAAFDRYDFARPNKRFVKRAFTLQNGAICMLFYFLALLFSLSIAATDDKIGMYEDQPYLWSDSKAAEDELQTWKIISLIRGVFAILGWLVVSIKPSTDRLSKNLIRADDQIYEGQQQTMGNLSPNGV